MSIYSGNFINNVGGEVILANFGSINQGSFMAYSAIYKQITLVNNLPQLSGGDWMIYPQGSLFTLSNPAAPSGGGGGTISRLLNLPWFVKI